MISVFNCLKFKNVHVYSSKLRGWVNSAMISSISEAEHFKINLTHWNWLKYGTETETFLTGDVCQILCDHCLDRIWQNYNIEVKISKSQILTNCQKSDNNNSLPRIQNNFSDTKI